MKRARAVAADALRLLPGDSAVFGPVRRFRRGGGGSGEVARLSPEREAPPRRVDGEDPVFARRIRAFRNGAKIKARFVERLKNGRFWGEGWGCVVEEGDVFRADLSPAPGIGDGELKGHPGWERLTLPRLDRIQGRVCVLTGPQGENFHHWLLDVLPRAGMLREAGIEPAECQAVIVPPRLHKWHLESLEKLGISRGKLAPAERSLHLSAEELIVPSWSEPGRDPEHWDYTPEGLEFVRRLFAGGEGAAGFPRRVYVSRARAHARRLLPCEECERTLEKLGFKAVFLEDLSLAEQAALFRGAEAVVMPTGGNLANVAHCRPGTVVIELFSPEYVPLFLPALTGTLGLRYFPIVGGGVLCHSDEGARADIWFDPREMGERVAAVLGG